MTPKSSCRALEQYQGGYLFDKPLGTAVTQVTTGHNARDRSIPGSLSPALKELTLGKNLDRCPPMPWF